MVICFCRSSHHCLGNEPGSGVQKENFSRELLTALNFSWHFSQFFLLGITFFYFFFGHEYTGVHLVTEVTAVSIGIWIQGFIFRGLIVRLDDWKTHKGRRLLNCFMKRVEVGCLYTTDEVSQGWQNYWLQNKCNSLGLTHKDAILWEEIFFRDRSGLKLDITYTLI